MAAEQGHGHALQYLKEQVWAQNPTATFILAELYSTDNGVPRNPQQAWKLHATAAELGYSDSWRALESAAQRDDSFAHFHLAQLFEHGRGTPTNLARAFSHYRAAAHLGHTNAINWLRERAQARDADAQCALGAMYLNGTGVPRDPVEAFKWYQMAADQRHPEGVFQLGYLYETGQGVMADPQRAITLYTQAAQLKHPKAKQRLRALIGVD